LLTIYPRECVDLANIIKNISELLLAIRDKGVGEIEPFLKIKHGPTIGDMYEGLTKDIAEKSIFDGLDLRVVSGKITNSDGVFSDQIDCMIVTGVGEKIPFTEDYVYPINNVVMVIEVKKKLHSSEMSDGYDNLQSVIRTQANDYRQLKGNSIKDAFRSIAKKPLNDLNDITGLDYQEQMLYHTLVIEDLLPVRVIFGYSGFAKENTLRTKFIEYLTQHLSTSDNPKYGYGPNSFPNLIVAGDYSLIKTNGMPYSIHTDGVKGFCWMASYRHNPILLLLELLWTRLNYQYNLPPEFFGDELINESLAPLLSIHAMDDYKGWEYTEITYSDSDLTSIDSEEKEWQPTILNEDEYIVMNKLCEGKTFTVDELSKMISSEENAKAIIEKLSWSHLIYVENGIIKLLTKECKCVIVPHFGFVAADDYDGRLMNWIMKKMKEIRKNHQI